MKKRKQSKQAKVRKLNKYSKEWTLYQQLKGMLDMLDRPKDAADIDVERIPTAPLHMLNTIF